MPPTTTGTSSAPAARSPSSTAGHHLEVRAGQDRQPDHVHVLLHGGRHDLRRGEPDALVDDLEPGVAGPHGDLLGAVGVPVQARLADQHPQPLRPAPRRSARTRSRTARELGAGLAGRRRRADTPVGARYSPNTSRSAPAHSPVVTPARAHASVAGIRFASVLARVAQRLRSARPTAGTSSRPARQCAHGLDRRPPRPPGRPSRSPRRPRPAAGSARSSSNLLTPTTTSLAGLDPAPALGERGDQLRSSCSRSRRRPPRRPSPAPGRSPRGRRRRSRPPWPRPPTEPSKRSSYSSRSVS